MPSPVEDIKTRLDLVEFIQSYLRLQKSGANFKATCPFHSEKTASFYVSPARQIWHCFGCGKGGDIFKFVMEIEGHDFPEALKLLAQRAGIVLRREDPRISSERNRLYALSEEAAALFERNLSLTAAVKNYLEKRGVSPKTIEEFRIGFAPQSWDFLLKALTQKGFRREEIEKAGLIIKSEDGSSWYDRFRGRIMFPITDVNGRVIGFGGRIYEQITNNQSQITGTPKTEAKYVNTPNTLIYDKSRVLYGFDKAKQEIRTQNQVVLVEGYMDCIMSQQAGVKNAIAVSGTALTPFQLKIIRRLCDRMISSFDTDAAGDSATRRSLALASQFEFDRRIAVIPSGKDPADAVLENPQSWLDAIQTAKPVVEFYFEKMMQEQNPRSVEGKKQISAALLPLINELTNEIEKAHWISELSRRLEIGEEAIRKELNRTGGKETAREEYAAEAAPARGLPTRRDLLEERLLALIPMVTEEIRERELANHYLIFTAASNQELFDALSGSRERLSAPHIVEALDILRFKGEVLAQMTEDISEEFMACKRELEKECVRERLLKLGAEIETKEKTGDQQGVAVLLQNFRELSDTLRKLN